MKPNKISELNKDDKILCINFYKYDVYQMGYTKLTFKKDSREDWQDGIHFSATSPIGCSSWIYNEQLENHCFLSDFGGNMYFFTLKPKQWKEDLKKELDFLIKLEKDRFNSNIKKLTDKVEYLILTNNTNNLSKIKTKIHNIKEKNKILRKIKLKKL